LLDSSHRSRHRIHIQPCRTYLWLVKHQIILKGGQQQMALEHERLSQHISCVTTEALMQRPVCTCGGARPGGEHEVLWNFVLSSLNLSPNMIQIC